MSALATLQREFMAALPDAYRRNIAANLHDALAAAYPVVRRLVGDAFFAELAERFATSHPPGSGDMNAYGAGLPRFLAAYRHARELPYLPDVARLEWACHEAQSAAAAPPIDFAALAAIAAVDRPRIAFSLAPFVRLVASEYRIAAIWAANQPPRDGTVEDIGGGEHVVVWRRDGEVCVDALGRPEWLLLDAASRAMPLGAAAERIPEGHLERVLGPCLQRFVADGILGGFRLLPAAP